MPRPARIKSESGYHHVIVRGIGRQLLFEDARDYRYYLWLLEKYSKDTGVTVCAYCMMNNHVHLLLFDKEGAISLFMKKMGISYTAYFNRNYERVGHLFQDRFKSEPIETESYLLSVFKYIFRNPVKAGVCPAFDYPWSSCSAFENESSFVDTSFLHGKFPNVGDYREFVNAGDSTPCMEADRAETKDETAKRIMREIIGSENGMLLQQFDYEKRNEAVVKLHRAGMSIREIERFTGISRSVIDRLLW